MADREVSLKEWVDRLPERHRAKREYADLVGKSLFDGESVTVTFVLDDDPSPPPPDGGWQEIKEDERIPEDFPMRECHLRAATFPKEYAHQMAIVMEAHFISIGRRLVFAPPLPIQMAKSGCGDGSILHCSGGTNRSSYEMGKE